jgi:hypothetical protein
MANRYIYSGATGTGDGSTWANAHTTLAAAITAATAGDSYWVAHDHAESTASNVDFQFKGTASSSDRIMCVNRSGTVPPVAADLRTTATISTTGATNLSIGRNSFGWAYVYGITFSCSSGGSGGTLNVGTASVTQIYEQCNFTLGSTAGQLGRLGVNGGRMIYVGCTLTVNSTSSAFTFDGSDAIFDGLGGSVLTGATIPAALFTTNSIGSLSGGIIRNCDFSNLGSSGYIQDLRGAANPPMKIINCKLNSTPFDYLGGVGANNAQLHVIGCGTTTNVGRNEIHSYICKLTTENTIVRTGGATDGIAAYSWKLNPQNSANTRDMAFETFEGAIWNTSTGSSKTLTIHCVTDNITLNNDELWLEVDYLGTAGAPVATRITSQPATRLTANANLTSDSGTAWTTTGLTTPVKQSVSVSFTPQMQGPIRWRIRYAKSSGVVYICPKPDLT